jgi:hypothetical protein
VHGSYTFNEARSDTQGVNYVPSVAQNPGLDYGRAGFGITNRLFLLGVPQIFIAAQVLPTDACGRSLRR